MIVVHASVLAVALGDDGQPGAVARSAIAGHEISVPDLVDVDTVSVWRSRWRAGTLAAGRFESAISDLADFPAVRYPTLPFMPRAFQLRSNVTAYDCTYVALAEAIGCALVTADARLANAPGLRCPTTLVAVSAQRS